MPENLNMDSHLYLAKAGFKQSDVMEIRFLCTELENGTNPPEFVYWHFSSNSQAIVKAAFSGSQEFSGNPLAESYVDLPPPKLKHKLKRKVDASRVNMFNKFGKDPTGGLHNSPFGSSYGGFYWTIFGDGKTKPRYECGTHHPHIQSNTDVMKDPAMIITHHAIFFRGEAPNPLDKPPKK